MLIEPKLRFGLIMLTGASLIACGKTSESDAFASDPSAATSGRTDDKFGSEFGEASRADPNSEPRNVDEIDVPPISLTAEPVAID